MTMQELKDKINYLINVKGVQPAYFWRESGAERSMFCRWRQYNNRKLSDNIVEKLEEIVLNY